MIFSSVMFRNLYSNKLVMDMKSDVCSVSMFYTIADMVKKSMWLNEKML